MHIGIASPVSVANLEQFLKIPVGTLPECIGGTNATVIISKLIEEGYKVSVYSLSSSVDRPISFKIGTCSIHIGYYRPKHRAWDLFRKEIEQVKRMILGDGPDIVHSNWSYEFSMGSLETGIPTLVTLRDWAPVILKYMPDHYRFARLILNNKVLNRAEYITANSPYIQKLAENKLKRSVPLIPNPLREDRFLLGEKQYRRNSKVIISVNNGFSKRKNVKNLIKSFSLVRNVLKDVKLMLVGVDYDENGKAHDWAIKNEVGVEGIRFLGPVCSTQLTNLYDQSDLLVHPSLEESFGNTLVEAMARKVPVVAGNASGAVPWVLNSGEAGVLVDVADVDSLAESMIKILKNKDEWTSYSQAGFDNAYSRFKASEIVKMYISEYKRVLKGEVQTAEYSAAG